MLKRKHCLRMYAGEFRIEEHTRRGGKKYYLMNIPYYLGTKLKEYIDYFITNYNQ
ncbi:MAG: hypothetical protein QNK23_16330 [Crocinitomicaceae bacterium]|nr:hypothetical protein [Crocinitomicaceae bacterium]